MPAGLKFVLLEFVEPMDIVDLLLPVCQYRLEMCLGVGFVAGMTAIEVVNFVLVLLNRFVVCCLTLSQQLLGVLEFALERTHFEVEVGDVTFMPSDMPSMSLQFRQQFFNTCLELFLASLLHFGDLFVTDQYGFNFQSELLLDA